MKIAITGSQGFIGSKISKELTKRNHDLVCIDNFITSINDENNNRVINCDITNKAELQKIKIDKIDLLVHLAAQSSGPKSFYEPNLDVKINIQGTINIIDWCLLNKIPKIMLASSLSMDVVTPN